MQSDFSTNDFAPSASLEVLQQRSELLRRLREFFHERGFTEVETPLMANEVIPELHIEPIPQMEEPSCKRRPNCT